TPDSKPRRIAARTMNLLFFTCLPPPVLPRLDVSEHLAPCERRGRDLASSGPARRVRLKLWDRATTETGNPRTTGDPLGQAVSNGLKPTAIWTPVKPSVGPTNGSALFGLEAGAVRLAGVGAAVDVVRPQYGRRPGAPVLGGRGGLAQIDVVAAHDVVHLGPEAAANGGVGDLSFHNPPQARLVRVRRTSAWT